MKVGSLFSGGGLGDYGLELAGMEIAFQVEIDEYCQKILNLRWPNVPKWRDIRTVKGSELPAVDLISGGFPCQPFSVAGQQRGKDDDRHLWPQMSRIISEVRPTWVVAENVPGIINIALDDVLDDLEGQGYETIALVFPAHALGANHRRERLWIVGYSQQPTSRRGGIVGESKNKGWGACQTRRTGVQSQNRKTCSNDFKSSGEIMGNPRGQESRGVSGFGGQEMAKIGDAGQDVADAKGEQIEWQGQGRFQPESSQCGWWATEPAVGRVANGVTNRVDRLKLLGNGQVVQVVQWIGERILEYEQCICTRD